MSEFTEVLYLSPKDPLSKALSALTELQAAILLTEGKEAVGKREAADLVQRLTEKVFAARSARVNMRELLCEAAEELYPDDPDKAQNVLASVEEFVVGWLLRVWLQ